MTRFRLLLFIFIFGSTVFGQTSFAQGTSGGDNGGGPDSQFKYYRKKIHDWIEHNDAVKLLQLNTPSIQSLWKGKYSSANQVVQALLRKMNDVNPEFKGEESDVLFRIGRGYRICYNIPERRYLACNFQGWHLADSPLRAVIVLHEYFGLLGIENDVHGEDAKSHSNYPISGRLFDLYSSLGLISNIGELLKFGRPGEHDPWFEPDENVCLVEIITDRDDAPDAGVMKALKQLLEMKHLRVYDDYYSESHFLPNLTFFLHVHKSRVYFILKHYTTHVATCSYPVPGNWLASKFNQVTEVANDLPACKRVKEVIDLLHRKIEPNGQTWGHDCSYLDRIDD